MQIFKIFFKVARRSVLWVVLMYMGIFAVTAVMTASMNSQSAQSSVELTTLPASVINLDNSELSDNLEEFFLANVKEYKVENDDKAITDAIFFGRSAYVLIIPEGFGNSFGTDSPINLISRQKEDSSAASLLTNLVDNYLSTAKLYLDGTGKIDYALLEKDMEVSTTVEMYSKDESKDFGIVYYFNYLSYPMLAILILCTSFVVTSFRERNLKMRTSCAPVSPSATTSQLLLGMSVFTLAIYMILTVIVPFIFFPENMGFSATHLLWYLNTFIFTLTGLSMGFLFSMLASKAAISALGNIVPLGCSFLGGVFVPQYVLSDTVRTISIFNPSFWFVEANDTIASLKVFNWETLSPVFLDMGRVLAFAAIFTSLTFLVAKKKQTN